jgi:hypothetical protein
MTFTLSASQVQDLISNVDTAIQRIGCDHSLRLTFEWASLQKVNPDNLLDLLEAHGCFCDCEVVCNLPEDAGLSEPLEKQKADNANPWKLPSDYIVSDKTIKFNRHLVSGSTDFKNCYAPNNDILVPAPFGAKARKRVRQSMHFFVGLRSGLPNEIGFIRTCSPITAQQFAKFVRESGHPELSAFRAEEAHFVLSRLQNLPDGTPVAAHFMDVNGINGKRWELRAHRVMLQKR